MNRLNEMIQIVDETTEQFQTVVGTAAESYWQGRKDAVRSLVAIIISDPDWKESLERLNASSPGFRKFDQEIIVELLGDVVRDVAAIVWEIKVLEKYDARTLENLQNFVKRYDDLADSGALPVINDHCLGPD